MILLTCAATAAVALALITIHVIRRRIADAYTRGYRTAQIDLDDLRSEVHDLEQRLAMFASAVHQLPGGVA